MSSIIIIHGSYGGPNENQFPWLKEKLKKLNYNVLVPKFPTPKNQNLDSWLEIFKEYKKYLDENTIFIGHSLGPAFLLNVLEKLDKPIRAAFFISGFTGLLNNAIFDKINKTFTDKQFNWDKIKNNCKKFYVFHSDNDPYVPFEKAEDLAKNLGVNAILVKNAGHFNESSGYKKFEILLNEI